MMDAKYSMKIRVPSYDLDQDRHLRLSSILKYMQEVAGRHLDQDNETYENMRKSGIVFLLSQIALKITRLPVYSERILCTTWFRQTKGAQFLRSMVFHDGEGKNLIEAETGWFIADPESHRILRPNRCPFQMPPAIVEKTDISAVRIALPPDMPVVGHRKVRGSDIDCNSHLANTVYADIIYDFLPAQVKSEEISELQLGFLGEARNGEEIEVRSCRNDGVIYYDGSTRTHRCFSAECKIIKKTA